MCTSSFAANTHRHSSVHLSCTPTLQTLGSKLQAPGSIKQTKRGSPGDHVSGSAPSGMASSGQPVNLTSWSGAQVLPVEGP